MALNYKILDKKPVVEQDGLRYMDLLSQTIDPTTEITGSFLVINKHYVARPDLISLAVYGDDQYADILCKINGISNPFEMNENDVIIIPHVEVLQDITRVSPVVSQFITDNNPVTFISSINDDSLQREFNSTRSPNEQTKGMKNLVIDEENGLLLY